MESIVMLDAEAVETVEPQPISRAERRDHQVQRIMEAAKLCFVRSGFQGASMQQICAEAGMSPGALYRYFPSKEAIVEAICEADRREDAEIFAVVLRNPDVIDGVVAGAMAHIRHMHDNHAAPLFAEICAESLRNSAVESTCMKSMQQVEDMFRDYVGGAVKRGEVNPLVELDVLLPTLMAIAHGMALNDLPARGVAFDKIDLMLRATAEALLRPTKPAAPLQS